MRRRVACQLWPPCPLAQPVSDGQDVGRVRRIVGHDHPTARGLAPPPRADRSRRAGVDHRLGELDLGVGDARALFGGKQLAWFVNVHRCLPAHQGWRVRNHLLLKI